MPDRTRDLLKLLAAATIAATLPPLLAGISKPESAVIALLAVAATLIAGSKKNSAPQEKVAESGVIRPALSAICGIPVRFALVPTRVKKTFSPGSRLAKSGPSWIWLSFC